MDCTERHGQVYIVEQDLVNLKCQPCREGTPPFTDDEISGYLPFISSEWRVVDGKRLSRQFGRRNFLRAMLFVNALAYLAEQQNHHPDMTINYNIVIVELSTHSVGGLSRNDFIMAAKIDQLAYQASQG
ncbi:MAG: 4a-hydroxytetrahydrobiopterin dehydratase [Dehalococcoidia bacterium]|nr:4a-hydroxytetrahydrobiopterin dehydratase [Dehalococcoidia bacterium]